MENKDKDRLLLSSEVDVSYSKNEDSFSTGIFITGRITHIFAFLANGICENNRSLRQKNQYLN